MNYIIFNYDGSVKDIGFADIIVQGDDNTDEIYCAIEGRSNDAYLANAYFELPNGDINSLSGVASSFSVDGSTYQGYKITLTASQTVFAGNVRMSLRLEGTGIKWTYNVILTINESGYDPDEVAITMAQYANLVTAMGAKQDKYVLNNARFYTSLEAAQADLGNLAINQCFIIANPSNPSVYPKIYFKTAQGTIQELNTLGQFDSPTIDIETATLTPSSPATVAIQSTTSGNDWSLAFSFGIPKGDKGDKGDTGATGAPGQDGTYVAYNLGNYENGNFGMLCGFASTYFQTDRPYGQTCYGTYSTGGSTYYCWFIRSYYNSLVCLRNQQIFYCLYNPSTQTWSWRSIGFTQEYTTSVGSFTLLNPGFYSVEYTPSGLNVPCTVTMSVRDNTKTTRSTLGNTSAGLPWEAVYEPGTGIKIYEDGTLVSTPTATLTLIAEYMRGTN